MVFHTYANALSRFMGVFLLNSTSLQMQENSDVLCYWLSNSATLLMLLQRTITVASTPTRRRGMSASLFGRVSQVLRCVLSSLKCLNSIISLFSGNYLLNRASEFLRKVLDSHL